MLNERIDYNILASDNFAAKHQWIENDFDLIFTENLAVEIWVSVRFFIEIKIIDKL